MKLWLPLIQLVNSMIGCAEMLQPIHFNPPALAAISIGTAMGGWTVWTE